MVNLQNEVFNLGVMFQRVRVYGSEWNEGMVAGQLKPHLDPQVGGREKEILGMAWTFGTSKPTPCDTLPPPRPHHLILLKSPQVGTKHSNI